MTTETPTGEIILYEVSEGNIRLDVRLEKETIWLNLNQISLLFDRDKSVISRHLNKVFKDGELERKSVVAKHATTAADGKTYQVEYFNLDAIISVGYRVNSKRGTQFRIWATGVLRDHILKGYTVNESRLRDLNRTVKLIADTAKRRDLSGDEAKALLAVVGEYNRALELLDDYDHQRVKKPEASGRVIHPLAYDEALRIVDRLRDRFGESTIFGVEKDKGLASALGAIMQTFGGRDVYPSLEEKAAHLLYFLVKNHAFVDGNKRIAAALFLWFLERNEALTAADGQPRISNGALVAATLLIAESRPAEKDILVRIITHLLCDGGSP
jgi:prophage maintenance system killer protein